MHEILTLQFGRGNYLGTHYWNTQESYFTYAGQEESPVDHDISFRAGIGADGNDTYTPRTLIYDLKGGFGTLRRENALYQLQHQEDTTRTGPWSGAAISLQLPPISLSPYQQALDRGNHPPPLTTDAVRYWSDYNHLFYHPRSIVQLNEYELNSSLMPFERWSSGEELFLNLDREHDLLDRDLRPFLEECDQLQGIQIFGSTDDAWGGFTSQYLERISDELGKGCRWIFGLKDSRQTLRARQMLQTANYAQSLVALNSNASIHIPLSVPSSLLPSYVSMQSGSLWQTSALDAAMVESITLPTRLRTNQSARSTFDQLEATLDNEGNRRIVNASMSVWELETGAPHANGNTIHDTRMTNGVTEQDQQEDIPQLDIDFSPVISAESRGTHSHTRLHTFSQIETMRAGDGDDVEPNGDPRDRFVEGPRSSTHRTQLLFPVLSSFPRIFRFGRHSEKLAIDANLSTTTAVSGQIRDVERLSRRLIGVDEREALCDGLSNMAAEYDEGWSDDGEDDDD